MQKKLQFQNKQIQYWIEGSGKPLMLVHGFAEDHRVWVYQEEYLKKNYQLILPDLPGSGKSALLNEVSMESMAEVLLAILDKEAIRQFIMIGHSMGGYVTLAFAEKYADRLNAFCLFHSTAYPDNEEKKQTRRKAIEFITKNGVEEFLKTTSPNLFAKSDTEEGKISRQEMVQKIIEDYKDFEPDALIKYYEAMIKRPDRTRVLKSFTKPILFLLGEYDTAVPYQQGLEQSQLAKNAEVHTLHLSGHMGMWEERDKSNDILADFCKKLS
jgi:pimeloyl-ACP methyl ester carboxylesterase